HAADIHLDSPLCGLARYEGAPIGQAQNATRRAFINLVDLACQESIDFVLLVGDLYDVDWKDYNTGLFFNQQMSRLREADISVFIVRGNHDAGNSITRQLCLPDNVTELSIHSPETKVLEHLGVAIHGQGFADKVTTENLASHYPKHVNGYYNIGLLHTSLNGREGHATYAPCTVSELLSLDYDYWALGHIHKSEVLYQKPYIVFPGNLQGRHVRETGAKGCVVVEVTDKKTVLTHQALDVLRWEVCQLEVSDITYPEEMIDKSRWAVAQALQNANGRPLALRFNIQGICPIHAELHRHSERWINEIRAATTDAGSGHVWVEKIQLNTQTLPITQLQEAGPLGELVDTLRILPQDNSMLQDLMAEFHFLKHALPLEVRFNEKGRSIDLENPDTIKYLLNNVKEMLLAKLLA
ncbi:MAG: DNA repair exonuclease, partial [Beggiatoa sp. IS2]